MDGAILIDCDMLLDSKSSTVNIERGAFLRGVKIRIYGSNQSLMIEKGVAIGDNSVIWLEGKEGAIFIGEHTSIEQAGISINENGSMVSIGKGCMFAYGIDIRTSDSHPIYCLKTGRRLNPSKSIEIGNHVWLGANTTVLKGATIGCGSIIGARSIVTRSIGNSCIAVGSPAVEIRSDVTWKRDINERL